MIYEGAPTFRAIFFFEERHAKARWMQNFKPALHPWMSYHICAQPYAAKDDNIYPQLGIFSMAW